MNLSLMNNIQNVPFPRKGGFNQNMCSPEYNLSTFAFNNEVMFANAGIENRKDNPFLSGSNNIREPNYYTSNQGMHFMGNNTCKEFGKYMNNFKDNNYNNNNKEGAYPNNNNSNPSEYNRMGELFKNQSFMHNRLKTKSEHNLGLVEKFKSAKKPKMSKLSEDSDKDNEKLENDYHELIKTFKDYQSTFIKYFLDINKDYLLLHPNI